jgi:HEAT repeat protein
LELFEQTLLDEYPQRRLDATIVLAEVPAPEAVQLLLTTLKDATQIPEVRAGAAWALGAVGGTEALGALIVSFRELDLRIRVEAARALANLARRHLRDVLTALPASAPQERAGIAWALSKAGGFMPADLLPTLVDDDARHWGAFVIGTQEQGRMMTAIEDLARRDREVYFAVTVLWKILSSWVYGLEEY